MDAAASQDEIGSSQQLDVGRQTDVPALEHGAGETKSERIQYGLEENPPIAVTIVYALQQTLMTLVNPLGMAYIIYSNVCSYGDHQVLVELLSIGIFMSGLSSALQAAIGIRLPIIQSSAASFIPPLLAILSPPGWTCPALPTNDNTSYSSANSTNSSSPELLWQTQLNEIVGSLAVASIVQVLIAGTGILGIILSRIGPLTITPTITLIGITIVTPAVQASGSQWGISLLTASVIVVCVIPLSGVQVPLPSYTKVLGCHTNRINIFRLFSYSLAMLLAWTLCGVLTYTDVFPSDPSHPAHLARTDARLDVLHKTPWIFFPYPGRWGMPTVSARGVCGMLAATVCSIIESVGDYYTTARVCEVSPPPHHAVNRGLLTEGVCNLVAGLLGMSHGTTSFSSTPGFIKITRLASRVVWQVMGVMMMVAGIIGKLGALLALVPDPIIGGQLLVGASMVITVGLANLQSVDMRSGRNQLVLGLAFCAGIGLPYFLQANPGIINTGSELADQVISVLLSTHMLMGGLVGFTLDNLLPGTKQERGICETVNHRDDLTSKPCTTYDLPGPLQRLGAASCCRHVPFMPTYTPAPRPCRRRPSAPHSTNV